MKNNIEIITQIVHAIKNTDPENTTLPELTRTILQDRDPHYKLFNKTMNRIRHHLMRRSKEQDGLPQLFTRRKKKNGYVWTIDENK